MFKRSFVLAAIAAVAVPLGAGATRQASPGFSTHVDNPWYPLRPGTTHVYDGETDGKPMRDVVTVTHRTKTVAGTSCVVVEDRVYVSGRLKERTSDWYAQDRAGNVWYFGEDTAELDASGRVTTREGSWEAGVDGAKPGIFFPAHPRLGQTGKQESYPGHAEDRYRVIALFGNNAVLTEEWTPSEPGVVDHQLYVRGVGNVLERTVKGGNEVGELVSVRYR